MTIQHIFSDLDGTLLNNAGEISPKNLAAIKKSKLSFTLVSARAPQAMQAFIDQLDLKSPQIAYNGGLIFTPEKILARFPLEFSTVEKLLPYIKQNLPVDNLSFYTEKHWYIEQMDADIQQEMRYTPLIPRVVDFKDQLQKSKEIFKILLIINDEKGLEKIQKQLEQADFPDISVQKTWESFLEITSKKAQKSTAIAFIRNQEKLEKSELAAFGDNFNDLPMLGAVGLPIAMQNAPKAVQNAAKFITKSNEEDGVAYGIEKILGKQFKA